MPSQSMVRKKMVIELGFSIAQRESTGVTTINAKETTMKTANAIRNHRNYDADDYDYLTAKGWTDAQILARWDEEAARGSSPCRWQTESARSKLAAVTGRR